MTDTTPAVRIVPELLPCPFCGGVAEFTPHSEVEEMVIVGCADGDCIGHAAAYDFASCEDAAACWNARPAAAPVAPGGSGEAEG